MAKRRADSTFTIEQETYIVEQFAILRSDIKVKRAFQKKFKNEKKKWRNLSPRTFKKVYEGFQKQIIMVLGLIDR